MENEGGFEGDDCYWESLFKFIDSIPYPDDNLEPITDNQMVLFDPEPLGDNSELTWRYEESEFCDNIENKDYRVPKQTLLESLIDNPRLARDGDFFIEELTDEFMGNVPDQICSNFDDKQLILLKQLMTFISKSYLDEVASFSYKIEDYKWKYSEKNDCWYSEFSEETEEELHFPASPLIQILGVGNSSIVVNSANNLFVEPFIPRQESERYGYETCRNWKNTRDYAFKVIPSTKKKSNEIKLFQLIRQSNKHLHNIVRMIPYFALDGYSPNIIRLEYIHGDSLENFLKKKIKLPQKKVFHYSSGILNGLLELRQAGIWHHRDIRPANIMIDEEKDRAVIIDLGIATTDKDALAKDNRRFGSPSSRRANDLNSLGQVVYKMATGEHIFAESKSMERTTYADELKDHRDWIYERPEKRLPPYLRRVEETVKDEGLCGIVKFCLASEGTDEDYQTLEARFKEYGN